MRKSLLKQELNYEVSKLFFSLTNTNLMQSDTSWQDQNIFSGAGFPLEIRFFVNIMDSTSGIVE